mmetsp:Transcript_5219/g.12259  ORF Transcript_5219/g.12259 Transcript_5219/m.12259 type:complete len:228 (-) Transcript_5219:51-734(-)
MSHPHRHAEVSDLGEDGILVVDQDVMSCEVAVDDPARGDMSHPQADLLDDVVLLRDRHLVSLLRQPVAEDAVLAPLQRNADAAIAIAEGSEAVDDVGMLGDASQDRDLLLDLGVPLTSSSSMLQHKDRLVPHGTQVGVLEGAASDRTPHIYNGRSQHSLLLLLLLPLPHLRWILWWSCRCRSSWAGAWSVALVLDLLALNGFRHRAPVQRRIISQDLRLLHRVRDAD